jgi:hypothetical protein
MGSLMRTAPKVWGGLVNRSRRPVGEEVPLYLREVKVNHATSQIAVSLWHALLWVHMDF